MAQDRLLSTQGLGLSLGALLLAWSLFLSAQLSSKQAPGGVNLRMSDTLGSASQSKSQKTVNKSARSRGGKRGSGARGVTLELSAGLRSDDNVYRTSRNEQRDVILEVEPSLYLDGNLGKHSFRLGYEGASGRYMGLSGENYFDNKILGNLNLNLDRRLKATLETSLEYGHDLRGDISSRTNISATPDRWHEHNLYGEVVLGRRIAKAQVGLGYGINGIRYTNNDQSLRDFDGRDINLFGRYNLGPKYALLAELNGSWFDYLDPVSDQSAREYTGLIGIAWEATYKTSGEFKIGKRQRDFYTYGIPNSSGFTWDAEILWSPRSYSKVTAYTSRDVNSSAREDSGGLTKTDIYGLRWRHSLTQNLHLETGMERSLSSSEEGTKFRTFDFDAGIRYQMNRWVNLIANWNYSSLSASDGLSDYQSNSVFIGFDTILSRRLNRSYE